MTKEKRIVLYGVDIFVQCFTDGREGPQVLAVQGVPFVKDFFVTEIVVEHHLQFERVLAFI